MNRTISILTALVAGQLALTVALAFSGQDYGAFRSDQKLMALDAEAVDRIVIQGDKGQLVEMSKDGDKWFLPDLDRFPVAPQPAEALLTKVAELTKGWPVATSSSAADRFKVGAEKFERKLTFFGDNRKIGTLFLGTSPSFRKVNARVSGEDEIYNITFNSYEASAKSEDWVDKDFLNLKNEDIVRATLPAFTLERKDEKFTVTGLKQDEETNEEEVESLIEKLAAPTFQSALGTDNKPEYGQDSPVLEISVELKDGEQIAYVYSKSEGGDHFVLKTSAHPYFFKVSKYDFERLKEFDQTKVVRIVTQDEANASGKEKLPEPVSSGTSESGISESD
jgi:hypothetical protein